MEHTSSLVAEGKWIDESSYQRRSDKWKEISIGNCRIDYFNPAKGIVREVKKSHRMEEAHIMQLKYYMYLLEKEGFKIKHGTIEYPKLRETEHVFLDDQDRARLDKDVLKVASILSLDACPEVINSSICKRCSYYQFCYIDE